MPLMMAVWQREFWPAVYEKKKGGKLNIGTSTRKPRRPRRWRTDSRVADVVAILCATFTSISVGLVGLEEGEKVSEGSGGERRGRGARGSTTHESSVVEPFRGEWSNFNTALSKCVGNEGGEGESSDEGRHRFVFVCFASVSVWTAAYEYLRATKTTTERRRCRLVGGWGEDEGVFGRCVECLLS